MKLLSLENGFLGFEILHLFNIIDHMHLNQDKKSQQFVSH